MKKKLGVVICLLLTLSLVTGCTTFNNFKNAFFSDNSADNGAEERTIKIGVYEPLTGQYKAQGNEERIGIELANELYPEVAGKKVELIYADNQSEMNAAETAIQELVAQKPSVILGSYGETVTLVAGDAVKANNIPAISITSTNPLITINNDYYFCATFSETKQGDALADFVYTSQQKKTAATVKVAGDDTATATIKRFTNRIKTLSENNDSVVGEFEITATSTDYSETIQGIKDSGARAVFLAVSPASAQEFLKQAEEANLTNILYVGTKNWNDEKFLEFVRSRDKLNVAYSSDFSSKVQTTEMSKEFLEAYKAKYGEDTEPSEATAVAFDAYLMALEAIQTAYDDTMAQDAESVSAGYSTEAASRGALTEWEEAQETGIPSGKAIRDALSNMTGFEGASGDISFGGTNEATKNIIVNLIQKGGDLGGYDIAVEETADEDTQGQSGE